MDGERVCLRKRSRIVEHAGLDTLTHALEFFGGLIGGRFRLPYFGLGADTLAEQRLDDDSRCGQHVGKRYEQEQVDIDRSRDDFTVLDDLVEAIGERVAAIGVGQRFCARSLLADLR